MSDNQIPIEHQMVCNTCGKLMDLRDASSALHGWFENDGYVCYDGEIPYKTSLRVGDSVEWTIDKLPLNLN